jgi:hypothetical protein
MALKGNQKKIDKNKNNRIDAEDFKLLKAGKMGGGMMKRTAYKTGGVAMGGGHKNYKMTGKVGKAKAGKMMKK